MKPRPLWRERDFRRLWIAQSVSDFGARITREGLPMMAVLGLAASPAQLGLLAALASGPTLIAGLAAGGLVDARRRRPLLVAADLVRAAVLVTIPLAAWMHALTIWQVYAAAALVAGPAPSSTSPTMPTCRPWSSGRGSPKPTAGWPPRNPWPRWAAPRSPAPCSSG